jgi:hypothetical protein|tara:strand:- start:1005 stop:1886 length:882 start_codon:yes stop_codon:yes gene_type:complete
MTTGDSNRPTETDIRTVTLTVDGIRGQRQGRDGSNQLSVYANIPALGSQYPTGPLWVAEEDAPVVGQAYTVQIRKGNLKKGKDGSRDWDYWWEVDVWNVQGVAPDPVQPRPPAFAQGPQAPVQPSSGQQGSPQQPAPQRAPVADPTRMSIERQVAAKEATQILIAAKALTGPGIVDEWLRGAWQEWADHIYGWISLNPAVPKPRPEAKDVTPNMVLPEGGPEPDFPVGAFDGTPPPEEPPFEDTGQLLTAAYRRKGWEKNKFEVYTALGLTEIGAPIPGDLGEAWTKLEEVWG